MRQPLDDSVQRLTTMRSVSGSGASSSSPGQRDGLPLMVAQVDLVTITVGARRLGVLGGQRLGDVLERLALGVDAEEHRDEPAAIISPAPM